MNSIYKFVEETRETGTPTTFEVGMGEHKFEVTAELIEGEIYFTYKVKTHCNDAVWKDMSYVEQFIFEEAFYPEEEYDVDDAGGGAFVLDKPIEKEVLEAIRSAEEVVYEDETKIIFKPRPNNGLYS